MSFEAVLLDMGGVLLDMRSSNGVPPRAFDFRGRQALLSALGAQDLELDDLERLVFAPWRREYGRRYQRGREADWTEPLDRLRRASGSRASDLDLLGYWFEPFAESLRPVPGARAAVEALAEQGLRLGVVSNVPLPGALYRRVLERHRLAAPIECFEFSYDSGHRKPSPYMLRTALDRLEADPEHAVMVGDRKESDVAAGRAAGMGTIWVKGEHRSGPEPDWTVGSIVEVPGLLERLR